MNTHKNLLFLGVGLLLLGFSSSAAARLCTRAHEMYINLPASIQVDDSVAVGTVVWSDQFYVKPSNTGNCTTATVTMDITLTGARTAIPNTYESGVPGIGYRVNLRSGTCAKGYLPLTCRASFGPLAPEHALDFELVKTGPVGSGKLWRELVRWWIDDNIMDTLAVLTGGAGSTVRPKEPPTCSVSSAGPIQAPLGNISAKSFKGVGSTSAARPFKIDLRCAGGDANTSINARVTLTDATNTGNRSNVLTLSADSQAKGVGIEVLNGGVVLGYGPDSNAPGNPNQWHAGTIAQGTSTFSIPLEARYVQTEPVVTPGTANGRATFTMSYQ